MPQKATHETTNPLFPLTPAAIRKLRSSDSESVPQNVEDCEKMS